MKRYSLLKILAITVVGTSAVILAGCGIVNLQRNLKDNQDGTFEIYLLHPEIDLQEKVENSACEAAHGPILSNPDIQSYDIETHMIKLHQAASERLSKMQLAGQPFVVCANQEPVYVGEFMAAFMSRSSERVVILWPSMEGDKQVIKIQLGYPGPDFYTGDDPRSDARILKALEQAGLIKEHLE